MQTLAHQRRLWRRATTGLVLLAATVLITPTLSSAGLATPFDDVGVGHPFRDEISEVADAGVAQGYDDGTYRPGDPVTRQAMAAFLSRAGSSIAVSRGTSAVDPLDNALTEPARVIRIDVPGDAETVQRVHVIGTLALFDAAPDGCAPCALKLQLTAAGSPDVVLRHFTVAPGIPAGSIADTISMDHVFELAGGPHLITLSTGYHFSSSALSIDVAEASLTATVIPFDALAPLPLP